MKLAKKAFVLALLMLTLVFTMSAQTLRSDKDPRNLAPTVGTGGPPGGPTGLFTVYDGQTLRKGEFTFSAAYSNFDRDPGNVDLVEVPVSFQFGLSDYLELWFNTDAYRAIKVNSPRNLSSFYLPNTSLNINGVVTRAPAIVLAPRGPGTPQFQGAIFRPTGAPFVSFPFDGGPAGNFGLFFPAGPVFGFGVGTQPTLGGPTPGGNGADNFPGVGSIYGGILPGVVLQTTGQGSGNCPTTSTTAACQAPTVFSLAPSYLPDAPFINRQFGESAFNTFTVGAKWRWTGPNNPIGIGIIPFYRFYADTADGRGGGFNQLQRGASPGGNRGDIGVILFGDARLRKWINISANLGYIYNSSVKGEFFGGTFTMLDRPDEVLAGVALDFPVNKYFQPILEFRSTQYVGGRTPNAFENSPIDGLAGARIFPTRWFSIGAAYRYHFNQQDADSFGNGTTTLTTTVIGRIPSTITTTWTGVPPGFAVSNDPHGFILQITAGRRNRRLAEVINLPPNVNSVTISEKTVTIPCPPGYHPREGAVCSDDMTVNISTSATDPENDVLTYNYTPSGGRIVGTGANVSWDLSGVQPGTYTVVVGVDDGCGVCGKTVTETVTVARCDCEKDRVECPSCPPLDVSGPSGTTKPGDTMTFTANVGGSNTTYNWEVSSGEIISGQGTSTITVQTTPQMQNSNVTATVSVTTETRSDCPACNLSGSATGGVGQGTPEPVIVGPATDDEIKAYIDGLYTSLNADPNSRGYIINYGTAAQIKNRERQIRKAIAFRKYDASRITMVEGGDTGQGVLTKIYVIPAGFDNPTP
jgi:PKD-like domain